MILLRALGAFAIIFSLSLFIFDNARELTSGVAYNYLLLALAAFAVIFFLNGDIFFLFKIKQSSIYLLIFFGYFGTKYYFESSDYEQTLQFLIGSSNGIIFSLFLGFMSAYALTIIYELRRIQWLKHFAFALLVLYLAYVLYLAFGAYAFHVADVRDEQFLIKAQEGHYQRTGDLLLMQFILAGSLVMLTLSTAGRYRFFSCLPLYLLLMAVTAILGITAQLIGSNSGLVGPVSFMFVVSVLYLIFSLEVSTVNHQKFKLSSLIFGRMTFKLLLGSIVSVGVLLGAGLLALQIFGVDVDTLRIVGYGEGENTSIVSRNEIFKRNFIPHVAHSPIFGHTQVEHLAGDRTSYVHSLASIQTHLGLVGFSLFLLLLFSLYHQVASKQQSEYDSLFSNQQYGLYRILAVISLLAMCSVSQFFTWMPMWFAFGMFGEWVYRTDRIRIPQASHRRRRKRKRSVGSRASRTNS